MEHPTTLGQPMPKPVIRKGKYVPWICHSEHGACFGVHIVWGWGTTPTDAYEDWKTRFIQDYGHL